MKPTVLEWMDTIPHLTKKMIVGRSRMTLAHVKTMPDGSQAMVSTSFYQSTPLWLIAITRAKNNHGRAIWQFRVWLRTLDHGLLQVGQSGGFVTTRGAEWGAYSLLNKITTDMRNKDFEFEKTVHKAGARR